MKNIKNILIKTILISFLFILTYYFLVLLPSKIRSKNLQEAQKEVSLHYINLLQNRLAYTELIKLDSDSPNFNLEKTELVNQIKNTNDKGQKKLKENGKVFISSNLQKKYEAILQNTEDFFKDQENILNEVFATDSFTEGIDILKSGQSIEILTRQTNIILEFQWFLNQLKE